MHSLLHKIFPIILQVIISNGSACERKSLGFRKPLYQVATSSRIFYRIIRAGIGVFRLLGLTKVMFVSNLSGTTIPSLPPTP